MPSQYGPRVITDGLILCLDAADRNSYSGVGTNFNDIAGKGNHTFLVNGPTYSNDYRGAIVLDGSKDYISGISSITLGDNTFTISMWLKYSAEPNNIQPKGKRKKIRFGRGQIHLEDDCDDTPRKLKFYIDDSTEQNLWAWGFNGGSQLGTNDTINRSTPVTVYGSGTEWELLSAGTSFSSAIKDNGTLWTWGSGGSGELGNNSGVAKNTPITTFAGGNSWKMISSVRSTSAAIKNDGTLWLWGYNIDAQLGINIGGGTRLTPVTTFAGGTNWNSVSAGYSNCAGIKNDGTLWVWGYNLYGQLGTNDGQNYKSTPVTTFTGGTNWKSVVCAMPNSMSAIKTDGTLWVWGRNNFGQLGINNQLDKSTPVTTFAGGTNWKQVACGFNYIGGIKTDGTLWLWGSGGYGGLGSNDNVSRLTPITTFAGGTHWKFLSCSYNTNEIGRAHV